MKNTGRKINIVKLLNDYSNRGRIIRNLKVVNLLMLIIIMVLSILLWMSINKNNTTDVLELPLIEEKFQELNLEPVELPPLPPILTKS